MPMTEIPIELEHKIVDVIGLLGMVLQPGTTRVRNGILTATRNIDGSVTLNHPLAEEIFKLAGTYRYFWRVWQCNPFQRPGLTFVEWNKFHEEAIQLCRDLDKLYTIKDLKP